MRGSGQQGGGRSGRRGEARGAGWGEEGMERVLAGLREVESPDGMERRVLSRMQEIAEGRVGGRFGLGTGWRWSIGAGVLAVLLVLAGVGGVRWRGQREVLMVRRGAVPAGRGEVGAGPRSRRRHAPVGAMAGGVAERRVASMGVPPTARTVREQGGAGRRSVSTNLRTGGEDPGATADLEDEARREELAAVEEMRAPSLVAPALPLTKEERLLQRAAQRGGADEMAALSEEERAKEDVASRAEFREFFGPARSEIGELSGKRQGDDDARN